MKKSQPQKSKYRRRRFYSSIYTPPPVIHKIFQNDLYVRIFAKIFGRSENS